MICAPCTYPWLVKAQLSDGKEFIYKEAVSTFLHRQLKHFLPHIILLTSENNDERMIEKAGRNILMGDNLFELFCKAIYGSINDKIGIRAVCKVIPYVIAETSFLEPQNTRMVVQIINDVLQYQGEKYSNYLGRSYRRLVEILCEKHEVKLSKTIHENIEMWCPNYRCNVSTLPMDVIAFSRWHLETCQTKHELISSILSVDTIVTTALQLVVGDARYINTSLYIEILLSIINSQHQSSVYKLPLGILEKLLHSFPNVADQTGSNSVLKVAFLNVLAFHRRHQHNLTEYCTEFWRWRQKLQTVGSPVISEI